MIVFDFEVFRYDWLVVFKDILTGVSTTIINDIAELNDFYQKNKDNLYIGFNNKNYDNYIYKVILQGGNPFEASAIIIEERDILKLYRKYDLRSYQLNTIDVAQDGMRGSLKEFEGYMGLDIDETSVPFDIRRPLTTDEINMTVSYCVHDVDATIELFKRRSSDVRAKMDLVKYFGLSKGDFDKTNAQLAAKILEAKQFESDDEFIPFDFSKININLSDKLGDVYNVGEYIVGKVPPKRQSTIKDFYSKEYDYDEMLVIDIAGVQHILRFGGLHGALQNYEYEGEMWIADVGSYYPSMMIELDFLTRGVQGTYREKFESIYTTRMNAKQDPSQKRLANALKLFINTVYGGMKAKFNALFDPHNANNVCVAGQLMLIELVEKLEPYITLVQSNTDGILFIPHDKTACEFIIKDWERRTRMNMEINVCKAVYQKDVNNYILVDEDDNLKLLGGFVRQSTINNTRPRDMRVTGRIIDNAVVNYFVNGIDPRQTINASDDLLDFQLIRKTGWTYDKTVIEYNGLDMDVQKVNRVYATLDKSWGKLYKVKSSGLKRDSHASLPNHCALANKNDFDIRNLDREYYISEANDRIRKFKEGIL